MHCNGGSFLISRQKLFISVFFFKYECFKTTNGKVDFQAENDFIHFIYSSEMMLMAIIILSIFLYLSPDSGVPVSVIMVSSSFSFRWLKLFLEFLNDIKNR